MRLGPQLLSKHMNKHTDHDGSKSLPLNDETYVRQAPLYTVIYIYIL